MRVRCFAHIVIAHLQRPVGMGITWSMREGLACVGIVSLGSAFPRTERSMKRTTSAMVKKQAMDMVSAEAIEDASDTTKSLEPRKIDEAGNNLQQ